MKDSSVQKEVAAPRAAAEVALRRRLQRAKREGDLPKNADPAELAHYVMTVVRGMAVQSAGAARAINYVESRKSHCARGPNARLLDDQMSVLRPSEPNKNNRLTNEVNSCSTTSS